MIYLASILLLAAACLLVRARAQVDKALRIHADARRLVEAAWNAPKKAPMVVIVPHRYPPEVVES